MSIRSLKTLVAVAESGSFAAGAERVLLTQAAVSMQMKALEEELGVQLFDRSRRPPELTAAGRALVPRAARIIRDYEQLGLTLDAPDDIEGELRLGAVPTTLTGVTPRALSAMQRRYPQVRIAMTSGLSAELLHKVEHGSLDCALVSDLPDRVTGLNWLPFLREPLIVVAPADAPDLSGEALLTRLPFIRYSRDAWVGRLIDQTLRDRQLKLREFVTLDSLEAIGAMVAHGLGVSLVPHRRIGPLFPEPVKMVPLAKPTVYRVLGLVSRSDPDKAHLIAALSGELTGLAANQDLSGIS